MKIIIYLLTAVFIASLGLFLVFYFTSNSKINTKQLINSWPVTSEPVSLTLNLSSPEDNLLTFDTDLLIQGKTAPEVKVIISSEEEDEVLESSSKGDFSTTIKLSEGLNNLLVTTFDASGNSKSEERTIFYSKEKL